MILIFNKMHSCTTFYFMKKASSRKTQNQGHVKYLINETATHSTYMLSNARMAK